MSKKTIKTLLAALGMTLSLGATAGYLNSIEDVRQVQDKYTQELFAIDGVNGVGITACDAETGLPDLDSFEKVYCLMVYTENQAGLDNLEAKYGPAPTELDGVVVNYKKIGQIVPQPGVTIGNH